MFDITPVWFAMLGHATCAQDDIKRGWEDTQSLHGTSAVYVHSGPSDADAMAHF